VNMLGWVTDLADVLQHPPNLDSLSALPALGLFFRGLPRRRGCIKLGCLMTDEAMSPFPASENLHKSRYALVNPEFHFLTRLGTHPELVAINSVWLLSRDALSAQRLSLSPDA
jgi:hypothetical protein